jgi:hypothetical protein
MAAVDHVPDESLLEPDPRKMLHISVTKLVIDSEPQRAMNMDVVERIANEWDWLRAEAATVVPIGGGKFRVVEGQHRVRALQLLDLTVSMWCLVLPNEELGVTNEAKLGRQIATGRRGYSTLAKWVSCAASNEPHEVQANKVLAKHGLRVGQAQSTRTIAAVGAVSKIVHGQKNTPASGADQLDKVIMIILNTWPDHDPSSSTSRFDGRLIEALGLIVARNPDLDVKRMVTKLASKRAMRWIDDVLNTTSGRSIRDLVAGSIITSYNAQLRTGSRLKL